MALRLQAFEDDEKRIAGFQRAARMSGPRDGRRSGARFGLDRTVRLADLGLGQEQADRLPHPLQLRGRKAADFFQKVFSRYVHTGNIVQPRQNSKQKAFLLFEKTGRVQGMKITLAMGLAGLFLVMLTTAAVSAAEKPAPIVLWPQGAPGEKGDIGEETDTTKPNEGLVANKRVIRLGNVSKPTLTFYPAPADQNSGAAVVIFPGGGYHILAMDLEGTEIAEWLNSVGVSAVVVKYRVPARSGHPRHELPLQDAQRAFGLVRQHAAEWGINPKRIGVTGFSAGAHLSAVLCSQYERRAYPTVDESDAVSCRPDFAMLIYPAYLTVPKEGDKIAPELTINSSTPPTFLVQSEDDGVRPENSLYYYLALKQAKVPAELHLYPSGGHGYGLRPTSKAVTTWPQRAEQFMRGLGVLEKKN